MSSPAYYKELLMQAAKASLAAMYPARLVERGAQDPNTLGDAKLLQGVFALIAEKTAGWPGYVGREAEQGKVKFAIVFYGLVEDQSLEGLTERVEQLENYREQELLDWVNAPKAEPLDCVYAISATNSRSLDAPLGWLVMELEAEYV